MIKLKYSRKILNHNSSEIISFYIDKEIGFQNLHRYNINPVNPDYVGSSEDRDKQAIEELFAEVLPDARAKGMQIWPVGFGDVNRIELNGYAPEGGQPGPESCQREIPKAVIAEPEDLPFEINKIINCDFYIFINLFIFSTFHWHRSKRI